MTWNQRGSKTECCLFCGQPSTTLTQQKIPVCVRHKYKTLENLKCACKSYLDLLQGKFGPFFKCFNCGTMNLKKALEINSQVLEQKIEQPLNHTPTSSTTNIVQKKNLQKPLRSSEEQVIRSDDPRFFD